jgi:hypothetical protein
MIAAVEEKDLAIFTKYLNIVEPEKYGSDPSDMFIYIANKWVADQDDIYLKMIDALLDRPQTNSNNTKIFMWIGINGGLPIAEVVFKHCYRDNVDKKSFGFSIFFIYNRIVNDSAAGSKNLNTINTKETAKQILLLANDYFLSIGSSLEEFMSNDSSFKNVNVKEFVSKLN